MIILLVYLIFLAFTKVSVRHIGINRVKVKIIFACISANWLNPFVIFQTQADIPHK